MKVVAVLGLIGFLAAGTLAQATGNIGGRVFNSIGLTERQAEIKIFNEGREMARISAVDGRFLFQSLAPGKYELVVKCAACPGGEFKKEVSLSAGETVDVKIELPETGIHETVTVAADTRQTVEQVSKTVDVITGQEMRDRADFSLVESLKTIPGFRVQQLGGFGKTASIKTRGLRNQDTALLIDGIRFRDASSITGDASPFLSDFTLTSVSRVEVLRGSGSSLYGTNAIGGVVDFQTPKPADGWHGQLSGAFGGLGLSRFRGNTSYGSEKFGFNLGASRTDYFEGIDGEDDAHNTNLQGRIDFAPSKKTDVSLRFFVSDAFIRLNSDPDTIGPLPATNTTIIVAQPLAVAELERYANGTPAALLNRGGATFIPDTNDPDAVQKSKFFNGQAVVTHVFNDKLFLQGYFQGLNTIRKNVNGPQGVGFQPFGGDETSHFNGNIYTGNIHFNWRPNETNEATIGYENEWEKFGNDGFGPGGSGSFSLTARQASHTFYAQDLLRFLNGRLQIAGGVRAQFFHLEDPELSGPNPPYANLMLDSPPNSYTFDGSFSYLFHRTGTKIRAHVGNGYRVPSLYERFGSFYDTFSIPNAFVALGDPNLKPERSIAFDGGIEQAVRKGLTRLSATYFYTKLIDIIGFDNVAPPIGTTPRPFGGYFNTKGGISRGAEFSANIHPRASTDIFASYTFTNSDQLAPQVAGSGITRTLGVPTSQFTVVATQRFNRFWVNADFLGTSDYLARIFSNTTFQSYVYRFKGARKLDLTAGYTFPFKRDKLNVRVFGTIENVAGYGYYENGFRTVGRTGRVGLSFGF